MQRNNTLHNRKLRKHLPSGNRINCGSALAYYQLRSYGIESIYEITWIIGAILNNISVNQNYMHATMQTIRTNTYFLRLDPVNK
ncbi:hypothetical protein SAMN04487894_10974 [Niabella drilacis]|uniref:Uncharacterized protein n=1 Tax=Niabella drilacis (strain DSM 25811 / CCM 8410 / CCUG 62505 / LMG 26954 / E90) TaxID=1285928 RepID=A0A1G6URY7_NIADE|nr:hypothetical protein SAMN04487894_10974 [Niabella drilacis]